MLIDPAAEDGPVGIERVLTALRGTHTLQLLSMTDVDLEAARRDSALFETLRITHELLVVLRDEGVLATFLSLPKDEQANFVRWIGATDGERLRHNRIQTFVSALKQAPLA